MIFQYVIYQDYLKAFFESQINKGRGQASKLAKYLGVSTVVVSQVLNQQRDFSVENAFKVTQFLNHTDLERAYFLKMVELAKAGSFELKKYFKSELIKIQKEAQQVKNGYRERYELSDEDKFVFYSERHYSAVRMASSLPHLSTIQEVSEYLNLPQEKVLRLVEFLVSRDLCKWEDGMLQRGLQDTFVPASSPYIKFHHKNWRQFAIEKVDSLGDEDLMYTAPMSLSESDFQKIRSNLLKTIQNTVEILGPSKDETLAYFSVDFLKL